MSNLTLKSILQGLRAVAPYLAVELILPGGTLVALILWLAQRKRESMALAAGRS